MSRFVRARSKSPAPGWKIEVRVEGTDRAIVERIADLMAKMAEIGTREIPEAPAKAKKAPCGCSGS